MRECPLNSIEIFVICAENHDTKECPSIPSLIVIVQHEVGISQTVSLCFVAKRPWKNQQKNMAQGFNTQSYVQPQNNWTTPMPW